MPLDLAFLVDGATIVGPQNFKMIMLIIKLIYHVLPVSNDGVHIGMVTFSDTGNKVFNFLQHATTKSLDLAIDQLTLPGGSSNNVGAGLASSLSLFGESGRKGTRIRKAIVTFLVGKPDDDPTIYSDRMKSENIISIVVAIGSTAVHANLIASSPGHVLLINNPVDLSDNLDKVIEMINKGNSVNRFQNLLVCANRYENHVTGMQPLICDV